MPYKCVVDGFLFIEGPATYEKICGPVEYRKDGLFNQQLKNLDAVRYQMKETAKRMGANAIINFSYGQKTTSWLRSMLLTYDDNINWYGKGTAVVIAQDEYNKIIDDLQGK